MYRLPDADALFDIGWEDYLDRGGVCAVEWSENVRDALPPDAVTVTIARCPENDGWRTITIEGGGSTVKILAIETSAKSRVRCRGGGRRSPGQCLSEPGPDP